MQSLALPARRLLRKRQQPICELQRILEGQIRHENAVARFGPPQTMVYLIAALRKDLSSRTKVH